MPRLDLDRAEPGVAAEITVQIAPDDPERPPATLLELVGFLAGLVRPGSAEAAHILPATTGTVRVSVGPGPGQGHGGPDASAAVAVLTELLRLHHKTAGLTATPSQAQIRLRRLPQPNG